MTRQILRGYRECAEFLGVAVGTLCNRSSKGTLPLEPIGLDGITLLYDRKDVEACRHLFKPTRRGATRSKAKAASKSRT